MAGHLRHEANPPNESFTNENVNSNINLEIGRAFKHEDTYDAGESSSETRVITSRKFKTWRLATPGSFKVTDDVSIQERRNNNFDIRKFLKITIDSVY